MTKIKMKRLITLLISASLITSVLVGCSKKENQEKNVSVNSKSERLLLEEFIENNHTSINIDSEDILKEYSILDEDAENYEIFLTGESHAIEKNFDLKFSLLKYFNQKAGVTYLLEESGYASAAFVNRYLETGDENILKTLFKGLKGTAGWNKESYEFWKDLRAYNLTLEEENRIKVIGIDIEHQAGTAVKYLISLIPENSPPEKIHETINKLNSFLQEISTNDELIEFVNNLKEDLDNNTMLYKEYLGDSFFDFSLVVNNIFRTLEAKISNNSKYNQIREEQIYSNFKKIYEHYPKGKYFGQWGREHIYQRCNYSYLGKQERFAMFLNNDDSPVKDKVLSISYGYINCYGMTWPSNSGEKYGERIHRQKLKDIDIIDKYSDEDISLFKLHGENSPFNNKVYFVQAPYGGVTTDYYQYLIIIRNSRGATPLGD